MRIAAGGGAGAGACRGSRREAGVKSMDCILDEVKQENIKGFWVPISGVLKKKTEYSDGQVYESETTVAIQEIDMEPDFDAIHAFDFAAPDGTMVSDISTPGLKLKWARGEVMPDIAEDEIRALDEAIDVARAELPKDLAAASSLRQDEPNEDSGLSRLLPVFVVAIALLLTAISIPFLQRRRRRASSDDSAR